MRRFILLLLLVVLVAAACSKLPGRDEMIHDEMVALADIPASYGELVSVTFAPQKTDEFGWRELWFENEDAGTITYVPVLLPEWMYDPRLVKTIERP